MDRLLNHLASLPPDSVSAVDLGGEVPIADAKRALQRQVRVVDDL